MEHVLRSGSWHFAAITVDYNSTSQSNYLYDATGTLHTILDVQIPYTASIGGGDPIKQTPDHPNDNDTEDPSNIHSASRGVTIGCNSEFANKPHKSSTNWSGSFDDVRYYDRILSSSEIEAIYKTSERVTLNLRQNTLGSAGNQPIYYNDTITQSINLFSEKYDFGGRIYSSPHQFVGGENQNSYNVDYVKQIEDFSTAQISGEAVTYEGTMLSGQRENIFFPINEKGTGTGRWTQWMLEEWQRVSGSYHSTAFKSGSDPYGNGFLTQSAEEQAFNFAHLERKRVNNKAGEVFPMYEFKSTRPDYFGKDYKYLSDNSESYFLTHSDYVGSCDYRQVAYESGSGTSITQKVKGGKVVTQARTIKYYEPAQFSPFHMTADINNRFDGCKLTSNGKDNKNLKICTPQDWLFLANSQDTIDGLPVVEVNDTTPTQLFVTTPPSGESDLEGY